VAHTLPCSVTYTLLKHYNIKFVYLIKSEFVRNNEVQNITGLSESPFLQQTTRYKSTRWHRGQAMVGSLQLGSLSISHCFLSWSKSSADTHDVQRTIHQERDVPVVDSRSSVWANLTMFITWFNILYTCHAYIFMVIQSLIVLRVFLDTGVSTADIKISFLLFRM
jgi:hypothetical protein